MERIGDVYAILPAETKNRAKAVVAAWAADWENLQRKYHNLLPNCEIRKLDLFWHAHILGEVEQRQERCAKCNAARWVWNCPADSHAEQHSCKDPMIPVVTRTGHKVDPDVPLGALRVEYLQCKIYRSWAEEQEARHAKKSKGRRDYPGGKP